MARWVERRQGEAGIRYGRVRDTLRGWRGRLAPILKPIWNKVLLDFNGKRNTMKFPRKAAERRGTSVAMTRGAARFLGFVA